MTHQNTVTTRGKLGEATPASRARPRIAAAGALLGAAAASSCCILPLALFSLGITGAWLGTLASLAPYQPLFLAVALGSIAYGVHLTRRGRAQESCGAETGCARAAPGRLARAALWISAAMVAAVIAYPWAAPWMLDI